MAGFNWGAALGAAATSGSAAYNNVKDQTRRDAEAARQEQTYARQQKAWADEDQLKQYAAETIGRVGSTVYKDDLVKMGNAGSEQAQMLDAQNAGFGPEGYADATQSTMRGLNPNVSVTKMKGETYTRSKALGDYAQRAAGLDPRLSMTLQDESEKQSINERLRAVEDQAQELRTKKLSPVQFASNTAAAINALPNPYSAGMTNTGQFAMTDPKTNKTHLFDPFDALVQEAQLMGLRASIDPKTYGGHYAAMLKDLLSDKREGRKLDQGDRQLGITEKHYGDQFALGKERNRISASEAASNAAYRAFQQKKDSYDALRAGNFAVREIDGEKRYVTTVMNTRTGEPEVKVLPRGFAPPEKEAKPVILKEGEVTLSTDGKTTFRMDPNAPGGVRKSSMQTTEELAAALAKQNNVGAGRGSSGAKPTAPTAPARAMPQFGNSDLQRIPSFSLNPLIESVSRGYGELQAIGPASQLTNALRRGIAPSQEAADSALQSYNYLKMHGNPTDYFAPEVANWLETYQNQR